MSARSRARLGRGPGGRGQRLLVGPRQPVRRQRLVGPGRSSDRSQPIRDRQAASAARASGDSAAGPASSASASRYVASASSVFPVDFEQPGDRRQAPADVGRRRRAGPRLGRQRLPRRQHRPVRRQRVLLAADLAGQLGQLEVRPPPAPAARPGPSPCRAGPPSLP